jgi:hypothetical protein
MDEWWSYRPADLLMFSPAIYWRLFESLNREAWPWAVVLGLGMVCLGAWWARAGRPHRPGRARPASARGAVVLLALAWLGVAWAFFWQRFAPISTAAEIFAWGFVGQALGLVLLAVCPGLRWATSLSLRTGIGLGLGAWALVGHPALAVVFERPMVQAEWLGLAPDPTVVATLAVLLLLDAPRHGFARGLLRALWALPLLWCAITGVTLWTLGETQALVIAALALMAMGAAWPRGMPRA